MLGVCASAGSATVYKWVDDAGVIHYSDQPNPKAQKLQVTGAQTYGAQAAAVTAPTVTSAPSAATPVCVIDSPGAGQVFLDTFSITGHVTLAHAGGEGSQTTLRMDGQDISGQLGPDGSFALSEVERGEHSLTLQVTNARGEVICQANAVSFSIRQRNAAVPGAPTVPGAPLAPRAPGVGVVH
ncbi:MAG TPA: DUF4124 domain-containing protein [Steroidobacteraceae bacterium]|nr:DUF4124 domain-containing protein [Steroidobacteraceae bacterium]